MKNVVDELLTELQGTYFRTYLEEDFAGMDWEEYYYGMLNATTEDVVEFFSDKLVRYIKDLYKRNICTKGWAENVIELVGKYRDYLIGVINYG